MPKPLRDPAELSQLLIEEMVGYRVWHLERVGSDLRLLSPNGGFLWTPGEWVYAECDRHCTEIPGEHHTCGIYAARDAWGLYKMGYHGPDGGLAVGKVGLAGKVIPGEKAHRAEKARPIKLWLAYRLWPEARKLGETYSVPVGLANTLKPIEWEEKHGVR